MTLDRLPRLKGLAKEFYEATYAHDKTILGVTFGVTDEIVVLKTLDEVVKMKKEKEFLAVLRKYYINDEFAKVIQDRQYEGDLIRAILKDEMSGGELVTAMAIWEHDPYYLLNARGVEVQGVINSVTNLFEIPYRDPKTAAIGGALIVGAALQIPIITIGLLAGLAYASGKGIYDFVKGEKQVGNPNSFLEEYEARINAGVGLGDALMSISALIPTSKMAAVSTVKAADVAANAARVSKTAASTAEETAKAVPIFLRLVRGVKTISEVVEKPELRSPFLKNLFRPKFWWEKGIETKVIKPLQIFENELTQLEYARTSDNMRLILQRIPRVGNKKYIKRLIDILGGKLAHMIILHREFRPSNKHNYILRDNIAACTSRLFELDPGYFERLENFPELREFVHELWEIPSGMDPVRYSKEMGPAWKTATGAMLNAMVTINKERYRIDFFGIHEKLRTELTKSDLTPEARGYYFDLLRY